MRRKLLLLLASASLLLVSASHGSPYAAAVVSYNPGSGYAAGYTNVSAVLGQPSTNDAYGDAVDPFDPAWQTNQMLSIGAGGWLTVEFDAPIVHYPNGNRDFIIFGNSFFDVTNFGASPDLWATQGKVVNDAGQTRVSVSRDGVAFYTLNPNLAPTANYLYPTDGSGDFQLPVNPALTPADFAGLTLEDIGLLYNGAAGGASYDTAWAQDTNGNPVCLPEIRYVRVDVLSKRVQITGLAAVAGTVLAENFSNNPAAHGWQTFGNTNLFTWDATNQALQVTWDSAQPNSYFYHPLGTIMNSNDDFGVTFDLVLNDAGQKADGDYQFELAIGFLNLAEAQNTTFLRGTGCNVTNLAEFDYFPADALGDASSLDATLIDTNLNYYFAYADVPLAPGAAYHVIIQHDAGSATLRGQVLLNGKIYTLLPQNPTDVFSSPTVEDFRLDTIAVSSYSDADSWGSSMLAHGTVKNFFITAPAPPVTYLSGCWNNNNWQVQFWGRTNWNYMLEKSSDLQTWMPVAPASGGNDCQMTLQDTCAPTQTQYYRVHANPRCQ